MYYSVYFRSQNKERWIPVRLGANPKQFAMHSDAVEAECQLRESKFFNGERIADTMIVSVTIETLKTDTGEQKIVLMEKC